MTRKMYGEEEWGENKRGEKVCEGNSRRRQMWARDERQRKRGVVVERMDCVHTPHTCQWLVVCGLRWIEGGRRQEEEWWKAGLFLILPGIAWRADEPLSSLAVRETVRENMWKVWAQQLPHDPSKCPRARRWNPNRWLILSVHHFRAYLTLFFHLYIHTDEQKHRFLNVWSWTSNPDSVIALPDLHTTPIYPFAPYFPLIILPVQFPHYKSPSLCPAPSLLWLLAVWIYGACIFILNWGPEVIKVTFLQHARTSVLLLRHFSASWPTPPVSPSACMKLKWTQYETC